MRILLLVHAFNSLAQRVFVDLRERGHDVSVEFDVHDDVTRDAVASWRPDVVVAPYLRRAIPEDVWRRVPCLVVHPGVIGDRGPSALDWAIERGEASWGVTILQANAVMDGGDVWASAEFPMRDATKSSLYRNEVADAAVAALALALDRIGRPGFRPCPLDPDAPDVRGRPRPPMRQADRRIDWARDDTRTVLRRIRAADGSPGVLDEIDGERLHLFDARAAQRVADAPPGRLVARRGRSVLRATVDGAVWIGHLKRPAGDEPDFKLPASEVLGERFRALPEWGPPLGAPPPADWDEIRYEERGPVGWLHFEFHNGAMSPEQCDRLRAALRRARSRPTRVIVLAGGPDFWSNGIHLNLIEASAQPADASWRNIVAIDDLALELLTTDRHLTVAALQGGAGAGGAFLALAADRVFVRDGVVLNPHYRSMGNLYGSEYWTYVLPRRVGAEAAQRITSLRLPVGAREAASLGLADAHFGADRARFLEEVQRRAEDLARPEAWRRLVDEKAARRARDEATRPLAAYRDDELRRMKLNFYGFDTSFHVARSNFVRKVPKSRTPSHLALHRAGARSGAGPGAAGS